ncbi:aminopeptidase [Ferviditalea candida]|uniref:Aminopeptidase n=1 Tax=Ferviditalea candida TaxID=3108399 RepID=A0ABU5ZCU2_9BACL|nr:aminopeptidase [Paenibacillaceae bacterium T2]
MRTFAESQEKYAELIVKVGANIQAGQQVIVESNVANADFARLVVKTAYKAGARDVHVEWTDDEMKLIKLLHAPDDDVFKEYPLWKAKGYEEMAEAGAALIQLYAPNPDLLKDADPERVANDNKARLTAMRTFRKYVMNDKISWTIAAVPTVSWAAKVTGEAESAKSMERMWELIFKLTRIDAEEPIDAWKEHIRQLKRREAVLNEARFKKLHYRAPGTDLTIELPEKHIWMCAESRNEQGVPFVPNLPTEEVFTLPAREGVNGMVASTKPLNYNGALIENFSLSFKQGRIVDFHAEKGYETLKKLIETDDGAHYLGEVALVPHDSPISNTNLIFFNTLFDENASCHLAIGRAYPPTLEGGSKMSDDELEKHGANQSLVHVDFMIGAKNLEIDGINADGSIVPVFRNGNWAFGG